MMLMRIIKMDMKYVDEASAWRTYRWNQQAVECYQRHCICDGCYIKKQYPNINCKQKEHVLIIYRMYGKPDS